MADVSNDPYALRALCNNKAKKARRNRELFEPLPEYQNQTTGMQVTGQTTTVGAQETVAMVGSQKDFFKKTDRALNDAISEHAQKAMLINKPSSSERFSKNLKKAPKENEYTKYMTQCKQFGYGIVEILHNSKARDNSNTLPSIWRSGKKVAITSRLAELVVK